VASAIDLGRRLTQTPLQLAEMEITVQTEIICPHCGESFPLEVDTSQSDQSIIEDCTVCCRPINLTIRCRPGVIDSLAARA
jgi:hypothetical protein